MSLCPVHKLPRLLRELFRLCMRMWILFSHKLLTRYMSKLCALRDIVNHPYVNHISFLCEDWVIEWRKFQKPTYGELSDYLTKSRGFSKSFFHGIMIVTISIEYCALA